MDDIKNIVMNAEEENINMIVTKRWRSVKHSDTELDWVRGKDFFGSNRFGSSQGFTHVGEHAFVVPLARGWR